MKRFVITISCLLCAALLAFGIYYGGGVYIDLSAEKETAFSVRTQGDRIQLLTEKGWEDIRLQGVDLGSGEPGEWSTDHDIDKETYLRWLAQIQAMGANVIRVYSVQAPAFYAALAEHNGESETPLYLLQGIWVNDYAQNSHIDALDSDFCGELLEDCYAAVDVLHGKRFVLTNDAGSAAGLFLRDVSRWVLGYVIGGEWTDVTVAYTDEKYPDIEGYEGAFLYTAPEATAFETMLAQVGDALLSYEADRYGEQRLITFANTRTTDPFDYPQEVTEFFRKCAAIDVEHILTTDALQTGLFASYSVYSYDLDYLAVMTPEEWQGLTAAAVDFSGCDGVDGTLDTYLAYLKLLNAHHTVPVVVMEFGAASGRGIAQYNEATGTHEGHLSEAEQGKAIVGCWEDIVASGCAGGCVFSWQDEWHKRSWNTMFAVDNSRTPYWSDAQSSDQHFGLLAFDPGEENICTVDGDGAEWDEEDVVARYADGSAVSMRYDERYLYFLIEKPGYVYGQETLYLPIDTTQKTGSYSALGLQFDRAVDFLIRIHTDSDSALLVQERYHDIHANFEQEITGKDAYIDPPAKNGTRFETAQMAVKDAGSQFWNQPATLDAFETGKLRRGNADPASPLYDSLADFAVGEGVVELRLPWALLNFADPSRMRIHDDYYDGNYGVAFISLRELYVGLGTVGETIELARFPLKGWGNDVTWHERLKPAYTALQTCWTGGERP